MRLWLLALTFDQTVSVSDLLVVGGGLITGIVLFIKMRDTLLTITTTLKTVVEDVDRIDQRQQEHHEWLIGAGIDRRHRSRPS